MRYALSCLLVSIATLLFALSASTTQGQDFPGGGPGGKGKGGFGGGPGGFGGKGKGKGGFGGGPGGFGGGPGGFGGGPGGFGGGPGGFGGKGKGGFGRGPGGFPGQNGFPGQPGDSFDNSQGPGNFNPVAGSGTQNGSGPAVRIIEMEDLDTRPAVARAGKLPKGLPSWFKQLDVNKDGQVSLYEWHRASKDLEEFRDWDRNDDGFITAEEALYKQRVIQIASAKAELDDDDTPSAAMKGFGKGPKGGGFGGKGKGNKGRQGPQ